MALPYARSQLVKFLTDRVIENVTKQLVQQQAQQPIQEESAGATSPDVPKLVASINAAFAQTYDQIEELEARIRRVEQRMLRFEKRWSWQTLVKVVIAVAVAFFLGFLAWRLLAFGGWLA